MSRLCFIVATCSASLCIQQNCCFMIATEKFICDKTLLLFATANESDVKEVQMVKMTRWTKEVET